MKKFLIFSLCLISSFFIIDKANALTLVSGTDYSMIESQKSFLDDNSDFQKFIDNYYDFNIYRSLNNGYIYYNNTFNSNYSSIAYGVLLSGDYENFSYENIGITFNKYPNYVRNAFIFLSEGDLPYITNINGTSASTFNRWTMRSNTIVINIGDLYSNQQSNYTSPFVYYFSTGEIFSYTTSKYYYYDITTGANDIYFKSNTTWNLDQNGTKYANSSFELESLVPPVNYEIQFSVINSSDNSQELYGDDSHITGAGIAINYFPKDYSLYNYYYYWEVDENGSPVGPPSDYSDWQQLTTSDRGIGAISVHNDGWLYAHITDKNGNLLYSSSYDWHMIGSLSLIPVNNNKISTFLTKISDNINYGGPISGIITIPINFISAIYNSFSGACRNFNLGALLGTNIVFTCFTLESILGSSITNTIDILCSFYIYYNLILFIISVYRKVVNLDDLDDYIPQHGSYDNHKE